MQHFAPHITPDSIGAIHLIGIGGIGISGMAELLNNLGYKVQGSDMNDNANTKRLRQMGVTIFIGHEATNIDGAEVVVRSSAVKDTNVEVIAARKKHIPVVERAEMLAELVGMKAAVAVAGSHGKTTTTSMVAQLFESAGLNPTVINGGIINARGTNAYLGSGDWLVAEADESDGTFIRLPATIGVVTNIDPEHLEHYGSFDALKDAFVQFIHRLPFYGFAVACFDHTTVREIVGRISDRKVISYGIDADDVDVRAINIRQEIEGTYFDVALSDRVGGTEKRQIKDVYLPMPGIHNVSNAVAAIAVMVQLKIADDRIIEGFKAFGGVKRRFTNVGEVNGITIIDDYGHHPKEIAATLNTAALIAKRKGTKVIAVVQPHRYSRVKDLFDDFIDCFTDADSVCISAIYAAGEEPIEGITSSALMQSMKEKHASDVCVFAEPDELPRMIEQKAKSGDLVVFLGAGTVT
ncbi:MAG: UDP-N-acetylmuramate--L-alanine ligase, partial [Rickettsiales bacterium]|nr:UDP-N-acetylmuramate--L-alanine ligase [Rickettsiales bacterium]